MRRSALAGLIRLDTAFPRPLGDMGQALTYQRMGLELKAITVAQATARRVIETADPSLLGPFVEAARELEAQGVDFITTSCGFLARHQHELAQAVSVPVYSSALLWCTELSRPGIVTFDAQRLGQAEFKGAGVPDGTPVQGLPEGELRRVILNDLNALDESLACAEATSAAVELVRRHPDVQHLVLECTNLPPYRAAIASATGLPVHDLETLILRVAQGKP